MHQGAKNEHGTESVRIKHAGNSHFQLNDFIQIIDTAPMAISITDADGLILYVNESFEQTTGYSATEVIGGKHSIISDQATPVAVYQQLWHAISANQTWSGTLVNRKKNGERYLADIKISPLRTDDKNQHFYVGIQRDVSLRHVRKTELHNKVQVLSALINTMPSAVALLDHTFNVVLDNLTYKTLTADFKSEPAHLALDQLRQKLGLSSNEPIASQLCQQAQDISVEIKLHGNSRWFSCRLLSLDMSTTAVDDFFKPNIQAHWVLTLTETTRERRLAHKQRLAELQILIGESEMMHAMQESMHAVLHQLQQPVNIMASALDMLKTRDESCKEQSPLTLALQAGQAALSSLQEAIPERPHEAIQSVNLNQIVHEVTEILSPILLKRSIRLRLDLNGTIPTFNGQPIRLRVALKQLLDNAIEAIDFNRSKQREILVRTDQVDTMLCLSIEDSGGAIDKKLNLKVFEPFFSTKPIGHTGSRGIGLSIVQQVVAEHCGTIQISTSKLGGAAFQLLLSRT